MKYVLAFVALIAGLLALRRLVAWRQRLRGVRVVDALADVAMRCFLVEPCPRCHESEMQLLVVSPTARSLEYMCLHCEKRMRAAAASPEAECAADLFAELEAQQARASGAGAEDSDEWTVLFSTPEAPLPYERTTRTPIPEAVRSEVWRRDQGECVTCSAKENLEFDHIIPVAKGGATSARNLQLLCRTCNQKKGAEI
jgi:hypothetical protein